ncbi:ATP-binding protein [Streptomyces acidicola]|nr:ATP-binding protein [Streptomyces acidicola]
MGAMVLGIKDLDLSTQRFRATQDRDTMHQSHTTCRPEGAPSSHTGASGGKRLTRGPTLPAQLPASGTPQGVICWLLPAEPATVPGARHRALDMLRACGLDAEGDAAAALEVIVSELVTNAVLHGAGAWLTLGMGIRGREVCVEVQDGSAAPIVKRAAACEGESGRGLALIAALASNWGTRLVPGGKTVWATLVLPLSARRAAR